MLNVYHQALPDLSSNILPPTALHSSRSPQSLHVAKLLLVFTPNLFPSFRSSPSQFIHLLIHMYIQMLTA